MSLREKEYDGVGRQAEQAVDEPGKVPFDSGPLQAASQDAQRIAGVSQHGKREDIAEQGARAAVTHTDDELRYSSCEVYGCHGPAQNLPNNVQQTKLAVLPCFQRRQPLCLAGAAPQARAHKLEDSSHSYRCTEPPP